MSFKSPAFPVVANGYSPAHVDEFMLRLARRARGEVAELRAQVEDLEAEIERLRAHTAPAVVESTHESVVDVVQEEDVDWAHSVIGRSAYDSWTEDQMERAAAALRGRRLNVCTPG
jgi:uncharacterized protein YhaN